MRSVPQPPSADAVITIVSTFAGHGRTSAAPIVDAVNTTRPKPSSANRRNARTAASRGVAADVLMTARSGAAANVQYNHSRPVPAITRIKTKVTARIAVQSFSAAAIHVPTRWASDGACAKSSRRACRLALTSTGARLANL